MTDLIPSAEARAMTDLLVRGDWSGALDLLDPLYAAGYRLALRPGDAPHDDPSDPAPALTILALGAGDAPPSRAAAPGERPRPWLCWDRADDPAGVGAALRAGALAVLPAALTGAALLQSVSNALAVLPPPAPLGRERRYAREELIALGRDAVLEVVGGVVAQAVLHDDGAAVLLGLCGPGQLLVGHPDDGCCLHLVAHTDATVVVRDWAEAAARPDFAGRLRARLRQMEAWSAAQARHYLDQRVLGILGLLAEQFGVPRGEMVLIDVRITHGQLASAVGATRTTVTRIVGELRARGQLATAGAGAGERFCLRAWETADHGM